MRLSALQGVVRRRILVNFRANPQIVQRLLPPPFRPKLMSGSAIVGLCLIRLDQIRPRGFPSALGLSSENAAHRIAVEWEAASGERCEGVYIPRRDTGSRLNYVMGGRVFPGEHRLARFDVQDVDGIIDFAMRTENESADVILQARPATCLPTRSAFPSLEEASSFFLAGAVGYSATRQNHHLDGLRLHTSKWHVEPLDVVSLFSAYYADCSRFPPGSLEFDSALIMRDIPHEWETLPNLCADGPPPDPNTSRLSGSGMADRSSGGSLKTFAASASKSFG